MGKSIGELRKACQTKTHETPKSEILPRKFSIYITKLLLHTKITANQVTVINLGVALVAFMFFVLGHAWSFFVGGLLLQFCSVLDCVDGEIARYRGTSSITGLYLDRLNHSITLPLAFMSISFGLYNRFNDFRVFIFGFSATISLSLITLVVFNMYASVLDVYLESKEKEVSHETSKSASKEVGIPSLQEHFTSFSSTLYNVIDFMLPGSSLGWIWLLLLTSLIDTVVPTMVIGSFVFNSSYLYLILYGALLPFGWLGLSFYIVKNRSPEKLHRSLFFQS
ncbi:MAG: CDP-alcohol phosphatidyltransferase family protein [Candidatus Bathyarchaeota archaeon]|jgi:hypothetical protein